MQLLAGQFRTGADRPSMIEFLTACTRLYSHVEDIQAIENELRVRQNGCAAKKLLCMDLSTFFKVDSLLHDWNMSLPSFLKIDQPFRLIPDPIIKRQRNICRVRYLYIRLRLSRPFLALGVALSAKCSCKPGGTVHINGKETISPDAPAAMSLVRDVSMKCVAAAMELAEILKHQEHVEPGSATGGSPKFDHGPPFWENVDYLYACGTVFLAARLCPSFFCIKVGSDMTTKTKSCWSNIFVLLERYERLCQNKLIKNVAGSCLRTLRVLRDEVEAPFPENNVTSAFDDDTRTRISQRIGLDQRRGRSKRTNTADSEPDAQLVKEHRSLSWIESLPIDLEP